MQSLKKELLIVFKKNKSGGGFTLLEVITAIFILTVGGGAAFNLIQQTLASSSLIKERLIASYLAQEGMELVKNLRDTAWLKAKTEPTISWDEYLPAGDWQADYSTQGLNQVYDDNSYLNIDANGFYSYSSGTSTKFKRKISISEKTDLDGDDKPDKMKASVTVSWQERGRTHNLEVLEYLTNWYEK